jgi:MinD superfamily P-loop ATPase
VAERHPFTLAIASGKGGTGKTLIATNVAVAEAAQGSRVVLGDCDVEAPNDHLFMSLWHTSTAPVEVLVAEADAALCDGCGLCRDACAYGAVRILAGSAIVFDELCHGCGLCVDVCPTGAMHEVDRRVGEVVTGLVDTPGELTLVTGRLGIGQVKSPSVIRAARDAVAEAEFVVLDAPPGVACSAVAAVRGADALLLVTEPTPFGLHDLELSLRLGRDLGLPMGVVVNRDTGDGTAAAALCDAYGVPIVARIPFSRPIAEVYARGGLVGQELPEVGEVLAGLAGTMRELAERAAVSR